MANCLTELKSEMLHNSETDMEIVAYEYWEGYDDSVRYFVAVHDFNDVKNIDYPVVEDIDAWDYDDVLRKFSETVQKYKARLDLA